MCSRILTCAFYLCEKCFSQTIYRSQEVKPLHNSSLGSKVLEQVTMATVLNDETEGCSISAAAAQETDQVAVVTDVLHQFHLTAKVLPLAFLCILCTNNSKSNVTIFIIDLCRFIKELAFSCPCRNFPQF